MITAEPVLEVVEEVPVEEVPEVRVHVEVVELLVAVLT